MFLFFSPSTGLWLPGSEPAVADASGSTGAADRVRDPGRVPDGLVAGGPGAYRRVAVSQLRRPRPSRPLGTRTRRRSPTRPSARFPRSSPASDRTPPRDGQGLPVARTHPESLFTLLGGSYDIDAIETVTQLCPRGTCEREIRDDFAERFGRIADDLIQYTPGRRAPDQGPRANLRDGQRRLPLPPDDPDRSCSPGSRDNIEAEPGQMDFLHAGNLPHKPWTMVPSLQSYTDPAEVRRHAGARGLRRRPPGRGRRPQAPPARGRSCRRAGREGDRAARRRRTRGTKRCSSSSPTTASASGAHRQAPGLREEPRPARLRAPVHEASRAAKGGTDPAAGADDRRRPDRRRRARDRDSVGSRRCAAGRAHRTRDLSRQLQGEDDRGRPCPG